MFRTMPIFGMSRDHNRKRLKTRTEWIVFEIQLFRERLSYKSVKAYATMSKGIAGNAGQRLLD